MFYCRTYLVSFVWFTGKVRLNWRWKACSCFPQCDRISYYYYFHPSQISPVLEFSTERTHGTTNKGSWNIPKEHWGIKLELHTFAMIINCQQWWVIVLYFVNQRLILFKISVLLYCKLKYTLLFLSQCCFMSIKLNWALF